ncbi:hypothetical protein [Spirosoma gilvum]
MSCYTIVSKTHGGTLMILGQHHAGFAEKRTFVAGITAVGRVGLPNDIGSAMDGYCLRR